MRPSNIQGAAIGRLTAGVRSISNDTTTPLQLTTTGFIEYGFYTTNQIPAYPLTGGRQVEKTAYPH